MRFIKGQKQPNINPTKIEWGGKVKTAREWAAPLGMTARGVKRRLRQGWSKRDALRTPKYGKYRENRFYL